MTPAGGYTTLHSFTGGGDRDTPAAELAQGRDSSFYGVTSNENTDGLGMVFKVAAPGVKPFSSTFFTGETALDHGVYYLSFSRRLDTHRSGLAEQQSTKPDLFWWRLLCGSASTGEAVKSAFASSHSVSFKGLNSMAHAFLSMVVWRHHVPAPGDQPARLQPPPAKRMIPYPLRISIRTIVVDFSVPSSSRLIRRAPKRNGFLTQPVRRPRLGCIEKMKGNGVCLIPHGRDNRP